MKEFFAQKIAGSFTVGRLLAIIGGVTAVVILWKWLKLPNPFASKTPAQEAIDAGKSISTETNPTQKSADIKKFGDNLISTIQANQDTNNPFNNSLNDFANVIIKTFNKDTANQLDDYLKSVRSDYSLVGAFFGGRSFLISNDLQEQLSAKFTLWGITAPST